MKKLLKNIFSVSLAIFLLFVSLPLNRAFATTSVEDQYCDDAVVSAGDHWWYIKAHTPLAQTFTPTKNRMDKISLGLAGGVEVNAPITMTLSVVGGGVAATKVETTQSALVAWVDFTFPTITIDTTKQYTITVTTTSDSAHWVISDSNCYAGGKAYVDGTVNETQDFAFVTYGYNYVAPVLTVNPPTSVAADYNSDEKGIEVNWIKSNTSGVEGYRIYRSTSKTTGFSELKRLGATATTYVDKTGVLGGTYYYYLMAIKGSTKSVKSSTVWADIPAEVIEVVTTPEESTPVVDTSPNTTTTTPTTDTNSDKSFIEDIFGTNAVYKIAGLSLFVLGLAGLIYFIVKRAIAKTEEPVIQPSVAPVQPVAKPQETPVEVAKAKEKEEKK